jgi:hypothetical protein
LSDAPANPHQDPRRGARRMIAYDDQLDISVFLTEHDRVFVHDGHAMNTWTVADPKEELRDWLPPGQYALAMDALSRMTGGPDGMAA